MTQEYTLDNLPSIRMLGNLIKCEIPLPEIHVGGMCPLHELDNHYCREEGIWIDPAHVEPRNVFHEMFHYIIDLARRQELSSGQEESLADWLTWTIDLNPKPWDVQELD